jgi:ABC-type transporter Mla maintaining outer membrane lipid asymmetry ATPase subunit MlaF
VLTPALLQFRAVVKDYGGLRPFRLEDLSVAAGEIVLVEGPDEAAASVLVDLATGTTLPDSGEVTAAGISTAALTNQEEWLSFLERFGIVNSRVVLLDDFTVLQNLAVPLTLDLEPLSGTWRREALDLANAVGLPPDVLETRLSAASPILRFRVRLGRAIAHRPRVVLIEHPTLEILPADVTACAAAIRGVAQGKAMAVLVISADARFAAAVATRRLSWTPSTGRLTASRGGRGWLGRG